MVGYKDHKTYGDSSIYENTTTTINSIFTLETKTMTPEAERFNGWAAMIGVIAAIGAYATTGQIIPGIILMTDFQAALLFPFVPLLGYLLIELLLESNDDDHDDDQDGGMLVPAYYPSS